MSPNCISGGELLAYSKDPMALRAFLEDNPTRVGEGTSRLRKSIVVLSAEGEAQTVNSALHVVRGTLPMILRNGKSPPSMQVAVLARFSEVGITTDPHEQRIGCDHISTELAVCHVGGLFGQVLGELKPLADSHSDEKSRCEALEKVCDALEKTIVPYAKSHFSFDEPAGRVVDCLINLVKDFSDDYSSWARGVADTVLDANVKPSRDFMDALDRHFRQFAKELDPCPYKLLGAQRETIKRGFDVGHRQQSVDERSFYRRIITFFASLASKVHLKSHLEKIPDTAKHVVIQGTGDISMNLWNVAAVVEESPEPEKESHVKQTSATADIAVVQEGRDVPIDLANVAATVDKAPAPKLRLVHVPDEKIESQQYTCLLAFDNEWASRLSDWKKKGDIAIPLVGNLAIGRVRMNRFMPRHEQVQLVSDGLIAVGNYISYALYGQCLAWNGKCKSAHELVREFSDLRHMLHMPNLNPSWDKDKSYWWIQKAREQSEDKRGLPDYLFSDTLEAAFESKPRQLFGVPAIQDVWLGEHAFLKNVNLVSWACNHPVAIPLEELGAPLDWITVCMIACGCKWKRTTDSVQAKGDFAWNVLDPSNPKLFWFPDEAQYPCTLVGIGQKKKTGVDTDSRVPALFLMAWGHAFDEDQRYSIFECAQILCDLGAEAVLLIDEGRDVFQYHFATHSDLGQYVDNPPTRGSLPIGRPSSSPTERGPCLVPPAREQIRGTVSFWVDSNKTPG